MGVIIFFIFCVLWYLRPVLTQGKENSLPAKTYITTILFSTIPAMAMILALQIGFGWLLKWIGVDTHANYFWMAVKDFILAGCFEEFIKYFCGNKFLSKLENPRRVDFILIMGAAGLGYEIIESLMLVSSPIAGIMRGVACLHIMWQYMMGEYLYRAYVAKREGNESEAKKNTFKAFFYPIILHGLNDYFVSIVTLFSPNGDAPSETSLIVIGVCVLLLVATIIVSTVWGYRYAMSAAREVRDSTKEENKETAPEQEQLDKEKD